MDKKFDFDAALEALKKRQPITGKDSVLAPLIKQLTEAALEAEIDSHLAEELAPNRRNGRSRKTMKSSSAHVEEMYGIRVSAATRSAITDRVIKQVRAWQQRPLDGHYPFVWLDYLAVSKDAAEDALDQLEERWGARYPIVLKSWREKWDQLSTYFRYPEEIRRVIYTTNAIEAVHRQFRKLTKTKGGFPNDASLLKLLYQGIQNASRRWTMPIRSWNLTLSQLAIYFEGRLDAALQS